MKVYVLITTWMPDGVSQDTVEGVFTDKLLAHKRGEMLSGLHQNDVDFLDAYVEAFEITETTIKETIHKELNNHENS